MCWCPVRSPCNHLPVRRFVLCDALVGQLDSFEVLIAHLLCKRLSEKIIVWGGFDSRDPILRPCGVCSKILSDYFANEADVNARTLVKSAKCLIANHYQ